MNGRTVVLALAWAALWTGASAEGSPSAQAIALNQDAAPEAEIKAAFLHNFARFTEWPERAFSATPEEFHLGLLAPDALAESIQRVLKDKKIGGRILKVVRGSSPADLKACAMVFVADAAKDQIPDLMSQCKGHPVLTVGESEGFAQGGGMLNFFVEQNKVKFEINPDAAARAGLKVTKLVGVAPRKVKDR